LTAKPRLLVRYLTNQWGSNLIYRCSNFSVYQQAILYIGLLCTLESAASSQEAVQHPNLVVQSGEHKLGDLIDQAARYLKRNYLFSDKENPGASFKLQESVVLNLKTCDEFISQIAFSKGYVMSPINHALGVYEFIYLQGHDRSRIPTSATAMTPKEVKAKSRHYIAVKTSITLKHLNADPITATMRSFFASRARNESLTFAAMTDRTILIAGFAPQVAHAIQLLEAADLPFVAKAPLPVPVRPVKK
jgi:hypothetical protein